MGGQQIESAAKEGYRMKTGVECEFFLLTNGVETEIADSKDVAAKPCYDQVCLNEAEVMDHLYSRFKATTPL